MKAKKIALLVGGGVVALIALIVLFGSVYVVDGGTVGVKKTLGSIQTEELAPGLHFKKPLFDSITPISTRLNGHKLRADAASKDLQKVSTEITVQHSMNAKMAAESLQEVGDLEKLDIAVVNPAVQESMKAVTAKYTAENLVKLRDQVKNEIVEHIKAFIHDTLMQKKIDGAIVIHNVAITDFDFSDEFNKSIEQKVKAEQDSLRALNEKTKRTTEADAKFIEQQKVTEGSAYEIEVVSKAKAAAIEREAAALATNPLAVLQLRLIERWGQGGGKLPTYNGGAAGVPVLGEQPAGK